MESELNLNTSAIARKVLSGELLLCDRGGRSKLWRVFSRIMSRNGVEIKQYIYCKVCGKVSTYSSVSTTNFLRHKCYVKYSNTENMDSIIDDEKEAEGIEMPANNLTKLLTRCVIKDCMPYDLIHNEGLKAVLQELSRLGSEIGSDIDVGKLLPSLTAVEKHVSEMYVQCFQALKADIASVKDAGFGLTINIYTDNFTKQSFIALTIHYVNSGVLKSRLLGLKTLEGELRTSQNIAEKVEQVLKDFDCHLSRKLVIVTDGRGCSDIIQAFPDVQNIQCITQLLNNALEKSLERVPEVAEIISACSKLVNFLKQMGLSTLLVGSLQTSRPTNWQSIYEMLNAVESSWIEIENKLQNINESAQLLTINIHHLKAVTKTCQPFKEAIETLEDDGYGTLHLVMVYLHELKKSCDTDDSEFKDFDFIESLKKKIRFYLERIVAENITNLHKLALFLYPPTNKLIQFSEAEKKCIESECICLMKCFENDLKVNVKQEPESPTAPASKRRKLFSDFVESETKQEPNALIMQEIQYYKNTRTVNSADFDAFNWWELQRNNFPLLYKLSCIVLATPASSAASKRIFETARTLLRAQSKHGSTVTELEKMIFLNSNAEHSELDSNFSD